MNKTKLIKLAGDMLYMLFIMPALVFWTMFIYAERSLMGFFSLSGFIMDGYKKADEAARLVFVNGLTYGAVGFVLFLGIVMFILSFGRDEQQDNLNNQK